MKYELVTTHERLGAWQDKLAASKLFAIDTETTSKDSMTCDLVGVCLAVVEDGGVKACYIPVGHTEKACAGTRQLPINIVLGMIAPFCECPSRPKVLQNAIYDLTVLGRYDVEFSNVEDTQWMGYALNAGSAGNGMDELADKYLGHRTIKFGEVVPQHPLLAVNAFQDVQLHHATNYAAEDTDVTLRLFFQLRKELKQAGLWEVYTRIDRPLILAGADIKRNGIAISSAACARLTEEWSKKIESAAELIQMHAPGINVGSTQQVQQLLFGTLDLPVIDKTDSGAPSTGIETLELLRDRHEVVDALVIHRKYSKLVGTYSQALPLMVHPETKRIHGNLNFTFTQTARLSSSNPNLQNIPSPAKGEEGVELRKAFVAPKGCKLIAADYSQIELRVLAHVTQDPVLIKAFHDDVDIHSATAQTVFDTTKEEAGDKWDGLRRFAKTINFGLVYGMSSYGLSRQLKIDEATAQAFIDKYFEKLTGVSDWIETTRKFARNNRFVDTIYGRRLYTNDNVGFKAGASAERQGGNYVIQGSAADLMRLAMSGVRRALIEADLNANLVLQVHDELLIEVVQEHAERARAIAIEQMRNAGGDWIKWRVPITVDAKVGNDWSEAH